MIKGSIISLICVFMFSPGYSQSDSVKTQQKIEATIPQTKKEQVYKMKPCVDIPIIAVGTVWSLYAFTKIYNKPLPTASDILSLNKSNVNSFDRGGMYAYNKAMDKNSYYPFYAAMPLPLIFFLTEKETRSDFLKLTAMYWEAMAITGFCGTGAVYLVDRYRPYNYFHNDEGIVDNGGSAHIAKNSFYAGHVETVAVPTFLIAKIYADYHPDSKIKWVFYGGATVATVATAYMRLKGGMHFRSDVIIGAATGTLAGILVPQLHKKRILKDPNMSIVPFMDGEVKGFSFAYKLR